MIHPHTRPGRRGLATLAALCCCAGLAAVDFGTRDAAMWDHEEWTLTNTGWSGNPFDLVAEVTAVHATSGETRTTQMFYRGGDTWAFRLTFGRRGDWRFTTSSGDGDLDGHQGVVRVGAATRAERRGFVVGAGNRFARQVDADTREGFLLNIFMTDTGGMITSLGAFATDSADRVRDYLAYAKARGFTAVYFSLNNHPFELGAERYDDVDIEDPDLATFDLLDLVMDEAEAQDMHVHFWRWGDEGRKWTPSGHTGGVNGSADRRVTRYFAARLGARPNWSMGYGFDLHEWVSKSELRTWADDFHGWLGWPHLLSARSAELGRDQGMVNGYSQGDQEHGDYFTDTFPRYATLVDLLAGDTGTPHLLEERNVLDRWSVGDEDTRTLMWESAMAGGIGGWYGFFSQNPVWGSGTGYANDAALATHGRFWQGRFRLDLVRDNGITSHGFALRSAASDAAVVYVPGRSSVSIDLPAGTPSGMAVVAVDAKGAYAEVDLGTIGTAARSIDLPYVSDWAIAIGGGSAPPPPVNQAPELAFLEPVDGAVMTAPADLAVRIDATDGDGNVVEVRLSIDGSFVRSERSAPYQWGTANGGADDAALVDLPAGSHVLEAVAIDDDGASTSVSITLQVEAAEPPPTDAPLVDGLSAASGKAYEVDRLELGVPVYIDRSYTASAVPAALDGQAFIRTANNDKGATGDGFLTFTLGRESDLYVAYDARAGSLPAWLDGWTRVDGQLGTTDVARDLYRRRIAAGSVSLGGNGGAGSMYNVVVVPVAGDDGPEPAVDVAISFQPASAPVPEGWLVDGSAVYADRGNGWTYGWTTGFDETRDRNSAQAPDQVHDTLNHLQKHGARRVWEIALPDGQYDVTVLRGDPSYTDQVNHLEVEGVAMDDPDGQDHYDEDTVRVSVSDGRLTIAPGSGASNAKICALRILTVPSAEG